MPKLTLKECLAQNGFLTYRIRGVSMQPMLRQGRDLFTVVPKGPERCKKYDVVLYRRPSDPYVLHRIIEVRPDSYVILGDNCIAKEYGIRDQDILGVLTSFQHNGHTVSVSDWRYRLYSRIWVFFQPMRIFTASM
ncbi:MAG: S24/S26 family peptidase [Lachnospiraceae bacterium]